jgi:hypothetical protein
LENKKIALGAIMKRQVRIVSVFVLVTFLFSTFVIPTNINAKVNIKQEVNFGEPGDDSGFSFNMLPTTSSNTELNETTGSRQEIKTDSFNIWYLYSKILCSQLISFIF